MSDGEEELHFGDTMDANTLVNVRGTAGAPAQNTLRNDQHDAALDVEDSEHIATGRGLGGPNAAGGRTVTASVAASGAANSAASGGGGTTILRNSDHDAAFDVEDDMEDGAPPAAAGAASASAMAVAPRTGALQNNPNDLAIDAGDSPQSHSLPSPAGPAGRAGASAVPSLGPLAGGGTRNLKDQPHDVSVDLSSSGSPSSSVQGSVGRGGSNAPAAAAGGAGAGKVTGAMSGTNHAAGLAAWGGGGGGAGGGGAARVQGSLSSALPDDSGDDDDDEDEEEDEELSSDSELGDADNNNNKQNISTGAASNSSGAGSAAGSGAGAAGSGFGGGGVGNTPVYNAAEYAHILPKVSQEIRDLFTHITMFQPQPIECPTKLRPFVPDFIPCIGDIDPFLKVPRPDSKPDNLGLVTLDEPSDKQTNATVVKNHLRSILRVAMGPPVVDQVPDAHNRPQVLDKWVADVKGQRKLQTNVNYSKPMPDITALMQEWPEEFEQLLNHNVQLPPPNIDLDMLQYVKLLCTLVDIPTHSNLVESLHLLFSTYLDLRVNQGLQHQ